MDQVLFRVGEHKLDSGNGVLKQEKQPMWPQGRRGHRKS